MSGAWYPLGTRDFLIPKSIPERDSRRSHTERLCLEVQPLTLLYTIFDRKSTPFVYFLLTNGTLLTNRKLYREKQPLRSGNQWRNSYHQLHPRDDAGADDGPIPLLFLHSILADEQSHPSLLAMIQIDSLDHLGSPRPSKHHLDQPRYDRCFGQARMVEAFDLIAMNPLRMDLQQVVWVSLLTVSVPSFQLNCLSKQINCQKCLGRIGMSLKSFKSNLSPLALTHIYNVKGLPHPTWRTPKPRWRKTVSLAY